METRKLSLWGPLLVCLLLVMGCAQTRTILSLEAISCQSCGHRAAASLEEQAGVSQATFDMKSVELTVLHDPDHLTPQALGELAERAAGVGVHIGAGRGSYEEGTEWPEGADVQWLTRRGEAIPVEEHVVAGKYTVFDYYAEWCGPCRHVDVELQELMAGRDDLAVRKLDVVDWDTPLARGLLANVASLPYVIVYGPGGARIDAFAGLDLERLRRVLGAGEVAP